MPKEVRHILFTPEELLRAIMEQAMQGRPTPSQTADSFHLELAADPRGDVVARIIRRRAASRSTLSWEVSRQDLHQVLLVLCHGARIPLPVRGDKRLGLSGPNLCLTVVTGADPGPPRMDEGAIRYADPELAPFIPL
ncbi:hypothetical protein G3576_29195 [Roseomonas stagni]|uniref:Uncharacterized protein n=1 Tax=Falsiroseomonas algicola TaxID=2716930 RepID=A0A6M1LUI0_9PROT|nr:hypothetical protein [Falsiroseomonas algicola]NGM24118.1 hypothetical protein [Falsiroseomonas algicola]